MISADGKVGFCISNSFQEVEALLPSLCYQCHDGLSTKESNEQVRSRRTIDPMGCMLGTSQEMQ